MKKEDAAKKLLEEQEKIKKLEEESQLNNLGVNEPQKTEVSKNLDSERSYQYFETVD